MMFHLVARTHGAARWFVPSLRPTFAGWIEWAVGRTDAHLLAYAVMPNHIHVLLQQGEDELAAVMQPLLRRIANRVQRHFGFGGGVFERPYRDTPCMSADHAREALMYIHLNPLRAGLCGEDLAYLSTTQAAYLPGSDPTLFGLTCAGQLRLLELFALDAPRSRDQLCQDYLTWLRWRLARDGPRQSAADPTAERPVVLIRPDSTLGDLAWSAHFAVDPATAPPGRPGPGMDLRDFIASQVHRYAPGISAAQLRGSWLPRRLAQVRRDLIRAATQRGYRTGDLARFFGVSAGTVSKAKATREAPRQS